MPLIKLLSDKTINQIAAGEVIERPVSVVKELIENSIDAGATNILIEMENSGKNLVLVSDNGGGIVKEQLLLAIQRHATSKLDETDINNITSFGFRGEALPSIASVSKTTITSRTASSENAWQLTVEGGSIQQIRPAARDYGTTVEARDLFCFTPTRLKFLKSDASEKIAAIDLINRFALANPGVSLKLSFNNKTLITATGSESSEERIKEIMGADFIKNSVKFESSKDGIKVWGFAGLPTFNNTNSNELYTFVNSRNVKDKLIINALRVAYINLIPNGRYPSIVIFIEIEPYAIDVNVHPTKSEIRFRDSTLVKNFISDTLRGALRKTMVASSTPQAESFSYYGNLEKPYSQSVSVGQPSFHSTPKHFTNPFINQRIFENNAPISLATENKNIHAPAENIDDMTQDTFLDLTHFPLGHAVSQVANTYIVAHNHNGIVIVDQHALHERLVLENIKKQLKNGNIKTQMLLVPEVVELNAGLVEKLMEHQNKLLKLGFNVMKNSNNQVLVCEIPAIFSCTSIKKLTKDLAEMLEFDESDEILSAKAEVILGEFACKNSIRAGRELNLVEMNALLRQLETTSLAGQCNHGRPTYIELSVAQLNKMFERT